MQPSLPRHDRTEALTILNPSDSPLAAEASRSFAHACAAEQRLVAATGLSFRLLIPSRIDESWVSRGPRAQRDRPAAALAFAIIRLLADLLAPRRPVRRVLA
ncbi:hypothetical protein [Nannocystis pusilla]|uniref:hypothetical protein n=1 Tax=Nannocystis pusilla TaxID=889268 RepID=UPI003DA30A79